MKTNVLDLSAYGVEEMSNAEMRETNGGIIWLALLLIGTRHPTGKEMESINAMMLAV